LARIVLAYDADCGPCTRFRYFVEAIDSKGEVAFVSLIDADDSGMLDRIPKSERHTSFHVIFPDGKLLTGADAVPPLLELLPGGKILAKVVTTVPGGRRFIAIVYEGFAKGHNGSACRYPRPVSGPRIEQTSPLFSGPPRVRPSRFAYLVTGISGGLLGAVAMGLSVRLPDALCEALASRVAGHTPPTQALAWGFHFLTAVLIGSAFGMVASRVHIGDRGHLGRSLLLGVSTGVTVWVAFFVPLMLLFLPALVTTGLVESSFVAHVLLGIVLGTVLAAMLHLKRRQAASPELEHRSAA
jgi:predicted DCC family thiol-disulfide oxidoreductase YuxK